MKTNVMSLLNIFRSKLPKGRVIWCIGVPYTKEQFTRCCCVDSDFIESLEFKYATNDQETLWKRYSSTANKIKDCVNSLMGKGVTILSVSSLRDLESVFTHSVVIITAHRHRYLDCFDFMGNAIPFDDVANIIPYEYNGIVDISSCHSALFQMQWKKKKMNAKYIAASTESSIDLRLFIYEHVIRYMVSHPNKSYLQSLEVIISRIQSSENKNTNKRENVLLGGNTIHQEQNGMSASAYAPSEIAKGDDMMIQVYVYENQEHKIIIASAKNADEDSLERNRIPLNFSLKHGDKVMIQLNIRHISQLSQSKSFVWQGKTLRSYFYVTIPQNYDKKKCFAEIIMSVNDAPLGELSFTTKVVDENTSERMVTDVFLKQYKKVFISYSHVDEDKVRYIDHAYEAIGLDHFFDRRYLKPGSIFPIEIQEYIKSSDLFILCWSDNALKSDYVKLELKQALERAYPNVLSSDKNKISIYPISIEPRAELPCDMKDNYHFGEI